MKACRICKEVKPLPEFYKHSGMKDGHFNTCKCCHNKRSLEWTAKNKDRVNANNRLRAKSPEIKEKRRQQYSSEAGKARAREAVRRYRKRRPMVDVAHRFIHVAIKKGLITRITECSLCGSSNRVEAHHDDYTKPEAIRWLCKECHESWHRSNKPIYLSP